MLEGRCLYIFAYSDDRLPSQFYRRKRIFGQIHHVYLGQNEYIRCSFRKTGYGNTQRIKFSGPSIQR